MYAVQYLVPINSKDMEEKQAGRSDEERESKYKWYWINVDLFPAKLAYFFEYVRLVSYSPNLVLFLTGIGLTKTESGTIMGLRSIGQLFGGPFWGIAADRWHCHKLLIMLICILSLCAMGSQVVVGYYQGDPNVNRCPEPTATHKFLNDSLSFPSGKFKDFSNETKVSVNFGNISITSNKTITVLKQESSYSLFWWILFLQTLVSFSESNSAFIDAATLRKSELSVTRKVEYCRQRMFGAIGGTTGVIVGNLAVHNFPFSGITCYAGFFIPYSIFALATAIALECLYRGVHLPKASSQKRHQHFKKILFETLFQKEVLLFFGVTVLCGMIDTPHKFLYLYLKELNSPKSLYTLSIVTAGISAFIGYFFSINIINFFGSTWKAMAFSFVVYGIRHFGYSLVTNPWLIILFEVLHMLTFSLFVSTGIYHVKNISPAPIITVMSSIFNALFYSIGPMIGLPLCGVVYERYGSIALFRAFSIAECVCGAGLGILAFILQKPRAENEQIKESVDEQLITTI